MVDVNKILAEVKQELVSEDEYLQLAAGIKVASPYTVNGVTMVQAHVSPVENLRLYGAPEVDIQYVLSDNDLGVPNP